MRKTIATLLTAVLLSFGLCASALAAEASGLVGYVYVQQVLQSHPDYKTAVSAVGLERQRAEKEFADKAAALDENARNALAERLTQQVNKREQELMEPILKKVRSAIAAVAKQNSIASVVDGGAMLYGGKDLTRDVIAEVLK